MGHGLKANRSIIQTNLLVAHACLQLFANDVPKTVESYGSSLGFVVIGASFTYA